jgi:hypothetical protein
MAKTIRVKQGPNGRVALPAPIGGKSWIEGDEPVEVESSRFFRRRIEAGDLILVDDEPPATRDVVTPESMDNGDVITTATPKAVAKAKE